jgi:acetylornithine deacetylase
VIDRIFTGIDRDRDEIVAMLADLVRYPSVNHRPNGDELAAQQHVEGLFRERDLMLDIFRPDEIPGIEAHPGWDPGSDFTDRPNVIGTRKGSGGGKSLLLLAHIDVVPEGPHELWKYGPFTPTIEGDHLIGRGSNDDKGGLAAAIAALDAVERAGYRPKGDVILASVVDEESGGANGTLAALLRGHAADGAVYCDGLDLEVHPSNLGGIHVDLRLQVKPEHAGVTVTRTMEILPRFYAEVEALAAERKAALNAHPLYAGTVWPDYAVRTSLVEAGTYDGSNPGGARLYFSVYVLPGESIDGVQEMIATRFNALAAEFDDLLPLVITWPGRIMPASAISPDDPFVDLVAGCYERATRLPASRRGMPMSDLFQFNLYSPRPMSTVAMGPGRWGDRGAHAIDESVLIDAHLIPFTKTLATLIVEWCGVEPNEGDEPSA